MPTYEKGNNKAVKITKKNKWGLSRVKDFGLERNIYDIGLPIFRYPRVISPQQSETLAFYAFP